jgi:integrase
MGTLQPYIEARRKDGVKAKSINLGLGVVRRILNVAASGWVDEHALTWLASAPKIKLLKTSDERKPYPLSPDGVHPEFVFAYSQIRKKGQKQMYRPTETMNNMSWQKARKRAGLPQVRVHDLKHTFGRRLRAAGVSFEDRQDLLGHKSGPMTTHYSAKVPHWSR